MNKILDLRFVIGVFFTIVGILLLGYGLAGYSHPGEVNLNKAAGWGWPPEGSSINRWCGILFGIFGIAMIILSFVKNADDDLLEAQHERPGKK